MGLNISLQTKTNTCVVSNVHPCSAAVGYGLKVNDVILHPSSTTGNDPGTYDLFLEAVKHRPIKFEVKRPVTVAGTRNIGGRLHALHRFVITKPGPLGMSLARKGNVTYVSTVLPNSLSDVHGILKDDIVCVPFTDGAEINNIFAWICHHYDTHPHRPLLIEVWRPVVQAAGTPTRCLPRCGANENSFRFAFPPTMPLQNAERSEAVPAKSKCHGTDVGKSHNGKERQSVILLVDDSDDASEDKVGDEKKKDRE